MLDFINLCRVKATYICFLSWCPTQLFFLIKMPKIFLKDSSVAGEMVRELRTLAAFTKDLS